MWKERFIYVIQSFFINNIFPFSIKNTTNHKQQEPLRYKKNKM